MKDNQTGISLNFSLKKLITTVGLLLLEYWIYWGLKQPIRLNSLLSWIEILAAVAIILGVGFFKELFNIGDRTHAYLWICYIVSAILVAGVWIFSMDGFHAKERYAYVAQFVTIIEDIDENSAFPNLLGENNDTSNLPLLGLPEAIRRAETEMGKRPALGSQFEIVEDEITSQNINNSLMYVVPLEPTWFWKWGSEGNHGYFIIDRNNSETEFKEKSLSTTPKAPFGDNAKRIIYNYLQVNHIPGRVTEISPEVDDNGDFFFVATIYVTDGIEGLDRVTGVVELNPFNQQCKYYKLGEIPDYIDRVFPEWIFTEYVKYYGEYKGGWVNSWGSQEGVQVATDGYDTIYIDGDCYYYTGLTSAGKDASSNGIIMMNCSTGEMEYHITYGISEVRAMEVAEGRVQEKEYKASYPLLLMVSGQETYFMLMRDKSNNLVGYAFVNYKDYTKAAVGDSLLTTQADYIKACTDISTADLLNNSNLKQDSGIIFQIANEVVDGNTMYYVRLTPNGKIFAFRSTVEPEIVFAEEGDKITIRYIDTNTNIITAIEVELE